MYIFSFSGIVHSVAKEAQIISVRVLRSGEMGYSGILSVCAAVLNMHIYMMRFTQVHVDVQCVYYCDSGCSSSESEA